MTSQSKRRQSVLIKAQQGVTIFEIIMVIAVAGIIIALSLQQYFVYEKQNQFDNLKANIDIVFRAMQNYYQANCQLLQDYTGSPSSSSTNGLLDPSNTNAAAFPAGAPVPPTSVPINLATQLQAKGYFSRTINKVPLLDTSIGAAGFLGYVAQFNLVTQPRTAQSANGAAMPIGTVYIWKAQIAVKILDISHITAYKAIMGADCISDLAAAGGAGTATVVPCQNTPPARGSYLVWERLPSFASPSSIPTTWPSKNLLKEFKDQYTHDTLYEMNNNGINAQGNPSYYLCGG